MPQSPVTAKTIDGDTSMATWMQYENDHENGNGDDDADDQG